MIERLERTMGSIVVYDESVKILAVDTKGHDPEFDRAGLHALMGRSPPPRKEDKQVEVE